MENQFEMSNLSLLSFTLGLKSKTLSKFYITIVSHYMQDPMKSHMQPIKHTYSKVCEKYLI